MTEEKDELNINFDKIKSTLKNTLNKFSKEKTTTEANQLKDDLFDIKRAKEFTTKHKTIILLIILLAFQFIPNYGFLPWGSINMRMQLEQLPIADLQAQKITYNNYLQQMYLQVNNQQPNLPQEEKQIIAKKELDKILKTDSRINKEIQNVAQLIRQEYSYEAHGEYHIIPPDVDPYYYYRLAENVVKRGQPGDTVKEGHPWDNHVVAPLGSNVSIELHPYTLAYLYKINKLFNSKTTMMQSAPYFPIIGTILTIIVLFFIGKRLTNEIGGITTATMFALNYAAFTRTAWGLSDTDAYNFFFPALYMLFFIEFLQEEKTKKWLAFLLCTSATIALYSLAWSGWWYLLQISTGTFIIYALYCMKNKKIETHSENNQKTQIAKNITIKTIIKKFIAFFALTLLFTSITTGYKEFWKINILAGAEIFINSLLGPLAFAKIDVAARTDLWPNVYTTVQELQTINLQATSILLGGSILCILAIIGLILLLKNKNKECKQIKYGIFLLLFTIATIYASTKGLRFILLIVVPASILTGYLFTQIYNQTATWKNAKSMKIVAIILLFVIIIITNANNISRSIVWTENQVPHMNKAWLQSLNDIKTNSQKDAIVTSWWDFGHVFAYFTDRKVTFDGGSQNTPMAYWVGRILSTTDEQEAIGILKMLACGSNKAYEELYEQLGQDTIKTIKTTRDITKIKNKEDAKKYLEKQGIKDTEAILKRTHCDPPENYFITSEDMRTKSAAWTHLGNWDFEKAYALQSLKNKPQEEATDYMTKNFNYTIEQSQDTYEKMQMLTEQSEIDDWLAPRWMYSEPRLCAINKDILNCANKILVNQQTHETVIKTTSGDVAPKRVVYIDEAKGSLTAKTMNENSTSSVLVLTDDAGNYYAGTSSPEIDQSMFTKLMYFNGQGLKHFKLFTKRKLIEGGFVSVWKINWNGTTPTTIQSMKTKNQVENNSIVLFNMISWIEGDKIIDSTIQNWKTLNITPETKFDEYVTQPAIKKMGAKQIMPELENEIIGMKYNQTKIIKIHVEKLTIEPELLNKIGNKTINFKVHIEKIK